MFASYRTIIVLFCFFALNVIPADEADKAKKRSEIWKSLHNAVESDHFKYFRGVNKERVMQFEVAYEMGDFETVDGMLSRNEVTIEDAGLIVVDHSCNKEISQLCVQRIAQDPYAIWKAFKKLREEA